ncbi:MAG: fasciclin domain-containing protein [Chitinophagales bacterium]|nr:fasciclin domain-containing protein [Chitinophagales bacterium]
MFLKFPRLFLMFVAVSLFLSSCKDDEEENNDPKTIVEIAQGDAQFSTLVSALTRANLVNTLNSAGTYTVFAPTNDAFNALLTSLGYSSLDSVPTDALTNILLYHVLGQEVTSSAITSGYVSTLAAGPGTTKLSLQVTKSGSTVTLNGGYGATVTSADIDASNGVIHVINKVLLPMNVVDIAVNNGGFTQLVSALTTASLVTTLSDASATYTVFAPTDAAFQAIASTVAGLSTQQLTDVLTYHVVAGANARSNDLSNGQVLTTVNGGTVTVNISGSTVTFVGANSTATLALADVQGTNGVVHVIDTVLLP